MKKSKLLVLGANSFAGAQLVKHAISSFQTVIGINRSAEHSEIFLPYKQQTKKANYHFYQLDINLDFDAICQLLVKEQPEYIIDLAGQGMVAESWQTPEQWYQTNIVAKVKLHNFLKDQTWLKKYIRVSTPEVYGSQKSLSTESALYNPSTPYAVSHAAIDMSLKAFYHQYNFPVIFTRFSNFYGAGQQLYRIIPRTIIYGLTNKTLELHGGGVSVRAFIHGDDVADALLKTVEYGQIGEAYHFSNDEFVSIRELVELIYQKMALPFEQHVKVVGDRLGKDANYFMSDKKARAELHWQPKVSLNQGISGTIDWVKNNIDEINTLELNYCHKV